MLECTTIDVGLSRMHKTGMYQTCCAIQPLPMHAVCSQEGSRFACGSTVLGGRFVLLSMLGKGGFSEVFKVRV
jgi:hypothetical protein